MAGKSIELACECGAAIKLYYTRSEIVDQILAIWKYEHLNHEQVSLAEATLIRYKETERQRRGRGKRVSSRI